MAYRQRDELASHVLTEEEVAELVQLRKEGWTFEQLAVEFDIHKNTVRNILRKVARR